MKKISALFFIVVLMITFAACTNLGKSPTDEDIPPMGKPSQRELRQAQDNYNLLINKMNEVKTVKIQMDYMDINKDERVLLETDNESVIDLWLAVLNKMRVKAVAIDLISGTGYGLDLFYGEEEKIYFGGIVHHVIYTGHEHSSEKVMYEIENLDEIKDDLNAIYEKMGYPFLY